MRRGIFVLAAAGLLSNVPAEAQQAGPRIGFLSANSSAAMSSRVEAFQQGLRELGYVDGQTILVSYQYANGNPDRLGPLAAELVDRKVEVIVTEGPTATRFAKQATTTVPIVMAQDPDPVGTGFVASIAKPGGNITGLSSLRPELSSKRLELLKSTIRALAKVAVIGNSTTPGTERSLRETAAASAALGLQLEYLEVRELKDVEPALRGASAKGADALVVLASPIVLSHRRQIADLSVQNRLPVISYVTEFVADGVLMSYGVSINDLFRRAATYVDRILKGASPAELPVEQPTKFELVINLKTAKALRLEVPAAVLALADEVIE